MSVRATSLRLLAVTVLVGAPVVGCTSEDGEDLPVGIDVTQEDPPEKLSEAGFFTWDGTRFTYKDRVVPYDLGSPLFSDYALKERAIYVPPGEAMTYTADGVLEFPVGSVILKHFLYPADLRAPTEDLEVVETRVLVKYADRWETYPYIWDADQQDATYRVGGEAREISFVDLQGDTQTAAYLIPQKTSA